MILLSLLFTLAFGEECGLTPFKKGTTLYSDGYINEEASLGRILGGEAALEKMFPWQVRLHNTEYFFLNTIFRSGTVCGGTLISMQVEGSYSKCRKYKLYIKAVVTAAHCMHSDLSSSKGLVWKWDYKMWQVSAGHTQLRVENAESEKGFQMRTLKKLVIHPYVYLS